MSEERTIIFVDKLADKLLSKLNKMHTLNNLQGLGAKGAEDIPLFHVVTFHEPITTDAPSVRLKKRKDEIAQKISDIFENEKLENTCRTLCADLKEEPGFYLFLGHIFPLKDEFVDGNGVSHCVELGDNTCFLMGDVNSFRNIRLKGSPFDTGGVLCEKSKLGKHVVEIIPKTSPSDYIRDHSAEDFDTVISYASCYIKKYFETPLRYVECMFQVADFSVKIDGLVLQKGDDSRNISFEVRCFQSIPLPLKENDGNGMTFVIAKNIELLPEFHRPNRFNIEFALPTPLAYASRQARKKLVDKNSGA